MEQKGPSPYTKQLAPGGYPGPNEPIPKCPILFISEPIKYYLEFTSRIPMRSLPFRMHIYPTGVTCPPN